MVRAQRLPSSALPRSRPFRGVAAVGLVLSAFGSCWLPGTAYATDGSVSAAVTPSEVALTPGAHASGVLLVANGGAHAASVRVEASGTDASVEAGLRTSRVTVPPGGSVPITFTVSRVSEGSGQGTSVRFVVRTVRRAVVAILNVKAATSPALVEAKLESNVATVNENRPGSAALVLTNPRETTARIDKLQVFAPDAVDVTLVCPGGAKILAKSRATESSNACRPEIAPRSQEVLPLTLETTDRVVPGPRTVLVKVTAIGPAGESQQQSVVVSTSFTVEVFAESDILNAVGVPVFLLLPGVVIVLTGWFLIRKLSPWRQVAGDATIGSVVSAATATAVVGLAVSLVVALMYPKLTAWLVPGYERDYLKAYGFRDFYYAIGYSFAIAVAVWLLASGGFTLARWLFLPWPDDDAPSLLRKVGVRGVFGGETTFPLVAIDGDKTGLQLSKRAGDKCLVVPRIVVTPIDDKAPGLAATVEADVGSGRAFHLWRTVESAVRRKVAEIGFEPKADGVGEPQLVDRVKLSPRTPHSRIVAVSSGE